MRVFLAAGVGAALAAAPAAATVTTVSGHFKATDWALHLPDTVAPPLDPLILQYSATFDATQTYDGDTAALTIIASSVPYPIRFSYNPVTSLIVLATDGSSGGCTITLASFCALITNQAEGMPDFVVQGMPGGGAWRAQSIIDLREVGVDPIGVPEPASWALLIAGFGLAGAVARRRACRQGSSLSA